MEPTAALCQAQAGESSINLFSLLLLFVFIDNYGAKCILISVGTFWYIILRFVRPKLIKKSIQLD